MNYNLINFKKMKIARITLIITILLLNNYNVVAMEEKTPSTEDKHLSSENYNSSLPTASGGASLDLVESELLTNPNNDEYHQQYLAYLQSKKQKEKGVNTNLHLIKLFFNRILERDGGINFEETFEKAHVTNTTKTNSTVFCNSIGKSFDRKEEVVDLLKKELGATTEINVDWEGKSTISGDKITSVIVSFRTKEVVGRKIGREPSLRCIIMVFDYNGEPTNPAVWSLKTAYPTPMIEFKIGNMKFSDKK